MCENTTVVEKDFAQRLEIEGVNFKGFGNIPKFVMLDSDLTLEAKTLYAYFCSFTGKGNSSFPGRNKITRDLKISKTSFYKHLDMLIENGYIIVKSGKEKFKTNTYIIVSKPKKIGNNLDLLPKMKRVKKDMITNVSLKDFGYGNIPKALMQDQRLSFKAKGLYAFFAAFSGDNGFCFPKVSYTLFSLKLKRTAYQNFCKELKDLDYIISVQRHENGKLGSNCYYINDIPRSLSISKQNDYRVFETVQGQVFNQSTGNRDTTEIINKEKIENIQVTGNRDTVKMKENDQSTGNKDTANQVTGYEDTGNRDTNINSININSINIKNKRSSSSSLNNNNYIGGEDEIISKNDILLELKKKIDYEKQSKFFGKGYWENRKDILDGLLDIMASVIYRPAKTYTVNQESIDHKEIINAFKENVGMKEIMYVIDSLESYQAGGGVIKNLRNFIIAAIFNSSMIMKIDYALKENCVY